VRPAAGHADARGQASVRSRFAAVDPSGQLQVIECADDTTGGRLFAVCDGLAVLRLCATHEQSLVFVRSLLSERRAADAHGAAHGSATARGLRNA